MMHKIWAAARLTLALAGLAGCAAPPGLVATPGGLTELHFAYDSRPDRLFAVAAEVCTAPAQRVTRPDRNTVECRSLLPPANTAAAILAYGGTIAALPESVIRFRGRTDPDRYRVRATVYLEIPRDAAPPVQVQADDAAVWRQLSGILVATGGRPEASNDR